jgi:GT2 family glycosyltransferase
VEATRPLASGSPPRVVLDTVLEPGRPVHANAVHVHGHVTARERPDVRVSWAFGAARPPALSVPEPDTWIFRAVLEAQAVPAGDHAIVVSAQTPAGRSDVAATATIDPARAWAEHAAASEPVREAWRTGPDSTRPPLLVVAVGPAAREAAQTAVTQAFGDPELHTAATLPEGLACYLATGRPWALFLEGSGALAPDAVPALRAAAEAHPGVDAIYGDEQTAGGVLRWRTAWSPDGLLAGDDAGSVVLVARSAAEAGHAAAARDIRELLLALDPTRHRVAHVPRVLRRRPLPAAAVGRRPPPAPRGAVTAVLATAYRANHVFRCIDALRHVDGLEVVLVDDASSHRARALRVCEAAGIPVRVVAHPAPFNFSTACNLGASIARGDELLFLNDDVEAPPDGAWLAHMRDWLHRPGVGAVGAKLVYPIGTVQHAGVTVGRGRIANTGVGRDRRAASRARTVTAVTGACVLVRREDFEAVRGFDPALAVEFGDVDLPLRLARRGRRTVWTPEAELVHHEGASRGRVPHPADHARFFARWGEVFAATDPYEHPAIDPMRPGEPAARPALPVSREPHWAPGGLERLVAAGRDAQLKAALLRLDEVGRERDGAVRREDELAAILDTVRSTRSWRWTGPVRTAGARLGRVR